MSVRLSVCLFVSLSVYLVSACLSVYISSMSVCIYICLVSACMSVCISTLCIYLSVHLCPQPIFPSISRPTHAPHPHAPFFLSQFLYFFSFVPQFLSFISGRLSIFVSAALLSFRISTSLLNIVTKYVVTSV